MLFALQQTDNERVVSKQHKCLARNATFEALYGLEYTQKNCELMTMHYAIRNCSMAYFYGLKKGNVAVALERGPQLTLM